MPKMNVNESRREKHTHKERERGAYTNMFVQKPDKQESLQGIKLEIKSLK